MAKLTGVKLLHKRYSFADWSGKTLYQGELGIDLTNGVVYVATADGATINPVKDVIMLAKAAADGNYVTTGDLTTALSFYYTKTEIDGIIAGLDATVDSGNDDLVKVTVAEEDGKLTSVVVDDSKLDTALAGKKDLQTAVADKGLTGATVLKSLSQNANGEISYETRDLTPADIGAQAAGNYKTIQTAIPDEGLTGATVLGSLSQDENGVITYTTRELTPGNIGAEAAGTAEDLIAELDAEKSSAAVEAGKGIQVTVKEVDGKIDTVTVSGNYDNAYDAKGAAAAAESAANAYADKKLEDFEKAYITADGGTIDKLNEIAGWIADDEAGAAKIISDVATNKANIATNVADIDKVEAKLNGIAEGDGTVKAAIDAALEAAKKYADDGDADTIYDDTALSNRVKANEDKLVGISTTVKAYVDAEIEKVDAAGIGEALDKKEDKANLKALAYKDTVATADINDDAVTADKLADNINEAIAKGVDAKGVTDTLGSAAFTNSEEYATAAQGVKVDAVIEKTRIDNNTSDYYVNAREGLVVGDSSSGAYNYNQIEIKVNENYQPEIDFFYDDTNDSHIKLTREAIEFNGEHAGKTYTLVLPAKDGTLATTAEVEAAKQIAEGKQDPITVASGQLVKNGNELGLAEVGSVSDADVVAGNLFGAITIDKFGRVVSYVAIDTLDGNA